MELALEAQACAVAYLSVRCLHPKPLQNGASAAPFQDVSGASIKALHDSSKAVEPYMALSWEICTRHKWRNAGLLQACAAWRVRPSEDKRRFQRALYR